VPFDDPLFAWALPDADRRQRLLPEFFALFSKAFPRHHQSYTTTGEVVAAALWTPPGGVPVSGEDAEELGRRIEALAGPDAPRFLGSTSCSTTTTRTGPTGTCSSSPEADEVGASLKWATAKVERTSQRGNGDRVQGRERQAERGGDFNDAPPF
jgi:hypothetical protein